MHPIIPITVVFIGCCSNVVFLEYLVKEYPGSGNIITFCQFVFIACEGFVFTTNFGRKKPAIPIQYYKSLTGMYVCTVVFQNLLSYYEVPIPMQMMLRKYFAMVAMFFVVQVVNNYALNFSISMPLHMIFRAGSLIANLILGVIILKRRYKLSKYLSVLMISIGIAVCTIVSAKTVNSKDGSSEDQSFYEFFRWIIGVSMLTFALFMSARMGIFQEQMYSKFGKHPKEALYYNHALPLPGFILLSTDIYQHIIYFNQSAPVGLPFLDVAVPKMWLFLIGNVLTQYVCIRAVFILTTECQSLTVTLVVTLRKFISLLFSIVYFKNPFTLYHWIGTALVFTGTLIFTEVFSIIRNLLSPKKEKSS